MSDFVTGFSAWVEMQNKLSGKITAIENILSCKMPPEWEDLLNKLEAQVLYSNRWPKGEKEIEQFDSQVSELVTGLPVWADAHCFPRLSLVRWAAMAFNHLNDSQNPDTLLNDLAMAEEVRGLADIKPGDDASALAQRLREKAKKVEEQQIDKAIEWAEQYLKKDAKEAGHDIESIADFLGRHENNPVQNDQKRSKIASIRKGLESELYHTIEEQQGKAKRKYQEWALKEILKFKEEFQRVSKEAGQASDEAKKGESLWDKIKKASTAALAALLNSWDDKRYEEIQNAMISHLLPIDLALLELPVLKLYHQAFEIGWKTLDGRDEQIAVAESSARVKKISLRALQENQS